MIFPYFIYQVEEDFLLEAIFNRVPVHTANERNFLNMAIGVGMFLERTNQVDQNFMRQVIAKASQEKRFDTLVTLYVYLPKYVVAADWMRQHMSDTDAYEFWRVCVTSAQKYDQMVAEMPKDPTEDLVFAAAKQRSDVYFLLNFIFFYLKNTDQIKNGNARWDAYTDLTKLIDKIDDSFSSCFQQEYRSIVDNRLMQRIGLDPAAFWAVSKPKNYWHDEADPLEFLTEPEAPLAENTTEELPREWAPGLQTIGGRIVTMMPETEE